MSGQALTVEGEMASGGGTGKVGSRGPAVPRFIWLECKAFGKKETQGCGMKILRLNRWAQGAGVTVHPKTHRSCVPKQGRQEDCTEHRGHGGHTGKLGPQEYTAIASPPRCMHLRRRAAGSGFLDKQPPRPEDIRP